MVIRFGLPITALIIFGTTACSSKPKPVEQKEPLVIAQPSKPMRSRAPKPLTPAQEAEIARAAAAANGGGSGGGGAGTGGGGVGSGGESGSAGAQGIAAGQAASSADAHGGQLGSGNATADATSGGDKWSAAWGADGVAGAKGIVYPVAPAVSGVSADMINALKLADTDPRRKFIGIWEQSGGLSDADFAHGGYRQTVLVFRTDGVLDVIRFFGEQSETRIDSRLMYAVGADNSLTISQDPKLSGVSRTSDLKLPGIDGKGGIVAVAPKLKLPAILNPSISAEEMTLDGKVYRKRKQTGG